MRTLRGLLLTAAALTAIFPTAAEAQQGRRFENAWFWGVKAGGMSYAHSTVAQMPDGTVGQMEANNNMAPSIGLDWMITRTYGGLYASYEQGFLEEVTGYRLDRNDANSAVALVGASNTRRINLAGVVFPPVTRWAQPYVGIGITFMQIASTETLNREVFTDPLQEAALDAQVTEDRTQFQPLAILGVQTRFQPFSIFVQGTATQMNERFLIRGGRSALLGLEAGIRYNIGSSVDRL